MTVLPKHRDAEKLGEDAHALTAAAIKGEKATPTQHHEAARAHMLAADAFAAAGNPAKANEHTGYADHHKGQIVQVPPPEEKPVAKSFADVMKAVRHDPKTGRFTGNGGGGKITASQGGKGNSKPDAKTASDAAHAASTKATLHPNAENHAAAEAAHAAAVGAHGHESTAGRYHASQGSMHRQLGAAHAKDQQVSADAFKAGTDKAHMDAAAHHLRRLESTPSHDKAQQHKHVSQAAIHIGTVANAGAEKLVMAANESKKPGDHQRASTALADAAVRLRNAAAEHEKKHPRVAEALRGQAASAEYNSGSHSRIARMKYAGTHR